MQMTTALPLGLLALALLATRSADELPYTPEEGAAVTRTFREKTELSIDSAVRSMGGEREEEENLEVEVRLERETVLVDEPLEIGNGRIEAFVRTVEDASSLTYVHSLEDGRNEMEGEAEGASRLAGARVLFTWDEEEGEYEIAFEDDESGGDDELLAGLVAETDLSFLLPEGEVSEGDEWDIEAEALAALIRPGGDLALELETDSDEPDLQPVILCYFSCLAECGEDIEGEVGLEYEGMKETDDGDFAAIALNLEISSSRDVLEAMSELSEALGIDRSQFAEMDAMDVDHAFEAEGTLLWDVEAGHAHSLSIEGTLETTFSAEASRGGMDMSMELVFSGTTEITVEVE